MHPDDGGSVLSVTEPPLSSAARADRPLGATLARDLAAFRRQDDCMAGLLVLAALLVLLAVCGGRGWVRDSRHPAWSAGRLGSREAPEEEVR